MFRSFLDVLFPSLCLGCGRGYRSRYGLCAGCLEKVSFHGGGACFRCGRSGNPHRCVPDEHSYQCVLSLAAYDGPWRQVVLAVKAGRDREAAQALAGELSALVRRMAVLRPNLVVPVPGSSRQWRRFDGVILLANHLATEFGLEYANCLKRLPGRKPQVMLSRQERLRGLENYITIVSGHNLTAKTVWLVDDVFTTGGTAAACAKVLLQAGAGGVAVLTIAN